jgi:hypothetical protein
MAADGGFDRVELGDAPQRFCRDRRAGGLLHLIELCVWREPNTLRAGFCRRRCSGRTSRRIASAPKIKEETSAS